MSANITELYWTPHASELLPKAVVVASFQTAYVIVFFIALYQLVFSKRGSFKTDLPFYLYLFATFWASWIFTTARIWGDQAQILAAMGLGDEDAANLPGYIDCSSLFFILAAADLLLMYRVFALLNKYVWWLIPLPLWMLANWGLYVVDIVRALDLGEKYTEASLVSSAAFDILGTALITGQLLLHRSRVEILGKHRGRAYGRLAIVFVESSLITSVCRFIWMAAFAANVQNAISWTECIAAYGSLFGPLLVIFRILGVRGTRNSAFATDSGSGGGSTLAASGTYNKEKHGHGTQREGNTVWVPPRIAGSHPYSTSRSDVDSQV